MKKTISLMLFAIMAVVLTSCGPTKEEAIDYNDKIINEQVLIIEKINRLYDAMKDYTDHYGMDYTYSEALKQVEKGTAEVGKLEKFGGNTEFRDGALKLFGIYKSVLDNELKKMVDISKLPDDQYTDEVGDEFDKLNDVSGIKMDDGLNELNIIQAEFAKKYKFEIEKKKDYK